MNKAGGVDRDGVMNGGWADDQVESWVARSEWIDDEEREFYMNFPLFLFTVNGLVILPSCICTQAKV